MSKISVIVPVYKVEKYIHRCVDSILAQTFTDFELILVDDGSPDNCGKICDEYAAKDGRVRVIHQENKGVSAARNAGIAATCGEYLIFVDSDDEVDDHYIQYLYDSITKSDTDLAICSYCFVSNNEHPGNLLPDFKMNLNSLDDEQKLLLFGMVKNYLIYSVFCKIYKSDIVKTHNISFDEAVDLGEDLLFVVSYLMHCNNISYISKPLYYYYCDNAQSLVHKYRDDMLENTILLNGALKNLFEKYNSFIPELHLLIMQKIFNAGYSDIMNLHTDKTHYKKNEIKNRINTIINNQAFQDAILSADTRGCRKIYLYLIKSRRGNMLCAVRTVATAGRKSIRK